MAETERRSPYYVTVDDMHIARLITSLLCVRPSSQSVKLHSVSKEAECVPEALAQGILFCKVGFCVSALCALQMLPDLVRLS